MDNGLDFRGREDVAKFVAEKNIKIINLCHVPEDGRLRTLSFSALDTDRVYEILEFGERVDGSNLFSFIEPHKSDIYIKPNPSRIFLNPFSTLPTLNVLCDYLDENGKPLDITPQNVLARAEAKLSSSSGVVLKGLAELEFYIVANMGDGLLFAGAPDRNYHESTPFSKFEDLRNEILTVLADVGIHTKYGHGEVGRVFGDVFMEQHEVEFLPQSLADLAETISIAKWVVRNVCAKQGLSVSFSPKVSFEHAGSGMHIHLFAVKSGVDGENVIANSDGTLSSEGLKMIGGILKFASSLSAFGNPVPVSYLRFIARKESPMNICWSYRNRLALIRVPLWWSFMKSDVKKGGFRETFEYRAPDALANAFLLFAGMALAVNYGLRHSEEALKIAKELYVDRGDGDGQKFGVLPQSCSEAAEELKRDRQFYEAGGVFPKRLVDNTMSRLKSYGDEGLWEGLAGKPEEVRKLLKEYLDYG